MCGCEAHRNSSDKCTCDCTEHMFFPKLNAEKPVEREPSGIPGMGKDAPMAKDGLQAETLYRFDLVDAKAMFAMTQVLATGAEKYGANNWRKIPVEGHINHALAHLYAYLAGDASDEHLTNALCRTMFALGVSFEEEG